MVDDLNSVVYSFLSLGLQLAIDGTETDQIQDILYVKIEAVEQSHIICLCSYVIRDIYRFCIMASFRK